MSEQNEKLTAEEFAPFEPPRWVLWAMDHYAALLVERETTELRKELEECDRDSQEFQRLATERHSQVLSLQEEIESLKAEREKVRDDGQYKLLFELTQAGWKVSTKQQPQASYLTRVIDGHKVALAIFWGQRKYRKAFPFPLATHDLDILRKYGFEHDKLPNQ